MKKPTSKLCPKCGKPFIEKRVMNSNYSVYIHKRQPDSKVFSGLIDYCIVTSNHHYTMPDSLDISVKLNPVYRKKKLQE